MSRIKHVVFLPLFLVFQKINAQSVEILGKVESESDVENIHVINKTAKQFTITDKLGMFKIMVNANDTLQFSSIQHKPTEILITPQILALKAVKVNLEELINELDQVIVGRVLTGNLASDIGNVKGKPPINFYDVGIPGYTGKPATQNERRLAEAGEFKPKMLLGLLGGGVPLNPILNGLTGRTKMLKRRVEIEEREALMQSIKSRVAKDFFLSNPLDESLHADFFFFCADDSNFIKHCKNKTDFQVLIFLRSKYKQYMSNLNATED